MTVIGAPHEPDAARATSLEDVELREVAGAKGGAGSRTTLDNEERAAREAALDAFLEENAAEERRLNLRNPAETDTLDLAEDVPDVLRDTSAEKSADVAETRRRRYCQGHQPRYSRILDPPPGPLRRPKAPLKEVALAIFLTVVGLFFALTGAQVIWKAPHWFGDRGGVWSAFPFTLMGCMTLIPGGYHLFIAVQAWRGVQGYEFSQIPRVEN